MKLAAILSIILLSSCGKPGKNGAPGLNGNDGANGADGQDGYSLVANVVVQSVGDVTCNRTDIFQDLDRNGVYSAGDLFQNGFLTCDGAVGAQGLQGERGEQGETGASGQDGTDGQDGQNGIAGTNGTNGVNGTNGLNADITYQVVEIIDPCGPQHPHGFDEVILKLGNGKYLASFSDNANGLNTRFGLLPHGNFITTDGTNCHFSI